MKSLKTPLRYPGGKSRAINKIVPHFPNLLDYKEYREPFIGGGSIAIHLSKMYPHLNIWVNDLYSPLVNFWRQLQERGDEMGDFLGSLKRFHDTEDKCRLLFNSSRGHLSDDNVGDFAKACAFYIVNKCSFSGLTESSSFSKMASVSNFSQKGIGRLSQYQKIIKNWKITNLSYEELLDESSDRKAFIYLDPPYDIKDNIYGKKGNMHRGFNHDVFARQCSETSLDCLVSYNSGQMVRNRFEGWSEAEFDHTYTMRSTGKYMREQKDRRELILMNYGKKPKIQLTFEGCYNFNRLKKEGLVDG
tara:strand:+ start:1789 stop:2697 length:909 start_codon:yes stop_codon:yes gene_type:complete